MNPYAADTIRKKVLIITYYWPPSGGPGVQRVLKLVKYLPTLGWDPIVLTVKDGSYPALDPSLSQEIPENCTVYATRTVEFFNLFKLLTGRKKDVTVEAFILNKKNPSFIERLALLIRQNLFLPDGRVGWIPFAVKKGLEVIQTEKPDLIFSSSPPSSVHLTAKRLANASGLPWVADFRDPWSNANYILDLSRSALASKLDYKLERSVVETADAILAVSKGVRQLLKAEGTNAHIVPNGFDSADFKNIQKEARHTFRITFTGHMFAHSNPINFFEALAALRNAQGAVLEVRFIGKLDSLVTQAMKQHQVEDMITLVPYMPHDEALKEMINADILLLPLPKLNATGVLSGKVFEYLATGNFILTIGEKNGDAADLIRTCASGEVYSYDDDLAPVIIRQIEKWKAGETPKPNFEEIAHYDRRETTKKMVSIFNNLLEKR